MSDEVLAALTAAGIETTSPDSFGPQAYDVPADAWVAAHEVLRDEVGLTFFDFLTASDELGDGFRVVTHLADFWGGSHVEHVMVRTLIPRATPQLASLAEVYAGANWHERETAEMFGITFDGHPNLVPLLLPDGFEGNPLRKEFVLASRVAKPWPGAKEPGESDHAPATKPGAPSRRRTLPPGVPDPDSWGPRPPGTPDPDPLAPALTASTPARPRRTPGERRSRTTTSPAGAPSAAAPTPDAPAPPAAPPADAAPPAAPPQTDTPAPPAAPPAEAGPPAATPHADAPAPPPATSAEAAPTASPEADAPAPPSTDTPNSVPERAPDTPDA